MLKKLLGAFVAVIFVFGLGGYNLASAETEFCDTWERYVEAYTATMGFAPLHDCDNGDCDDPATRDSWIPGPEDPITYVRVYFHIFCEDDGTNPATTELMLADQVALMNASYLPSRIQFVYDFRFVNSSLYRTYPNQDAMKDDYNLSPETQMNVYITNAGGGSNGTFPWGYPNDPLGPRGGVVLHEGHVYPGPYHDNVLSHETGHTLGLWHTHHGVSETAQCGECWERADGIDGDITGDDCSDTPPTPINYLCQDPGGTDVCSGVPWGQTSPENYMSYAPISGGNCWTEFTPQQWGRMRCWTDAILGGWFVDTAPEIVSISPDRNDVSVAVSANLSVTFSEGIDETTVNSSTFVVYGSATGLCGGTYSYNGTFNTATFTPTANFAAGEVVTAVITTGIESPQGTPLVEGTTWSFITATSGSSPGTFYYGGAFAVDNLPMALYLADLDGDNDLDLAVANRGANLNNISVLLNDGTGDFGPQAVYEVDSATVSITAADFDGDGDMDLAATDWDEFTVSVLMNSGGGLFATPIVYATGEKPSAVRAADLDGDTDLDMVVTNWGADNLSIYLNNGDGSFAVQMTYSTEASPKSLYLADFDDDGAIDVVTGNNYGNISVLLNNGLGGFPTNTTYATGYSPEGIVAVDLDGDGDIDLATTNTGSADVSILLGNGDGTFAAHTVYGVNSFPVSITFGDFDGDGDIDLAALNILSDNVSVLMNNGDGTFAAQTSYDAGDGPYDICAFDANGDGDMDLAVVSMYTDEVVVLRNRPSLPPAVPYLTSPANGVSTTDHTPTLNWSDVVDATTYDVVVDNDPNFGSINRSYYGRTVSYWTVSPSLTDGYWYWKARAVNEAGAGLWSASRYFRVYTSSSCPILFSYDGTEFSREDPLLTACEKSGYKDVVTDFFHVGQPVAAAGDKIVFQLRELEDEITYLDEIELITVDHADNTKIACSVDGLIRAFGETITPLSAVDHNGVDRLVEVSSFDDDLFAAEEAGYLIVTFPNTGSNQPMFAAEVPQKPYCPIEKEIYMETKPLPETNRAELVVSVLAVDGQWRELEDIIPSRSNTSNEMVISPVIGDISMDVVTLRFSWDNAYSTDAILQYVPLEEPPDTRTWSVESNNLVTAKPAPKAWRSFADGQLVLRKGDVFDFKFAVDEPVKPGQTRDYIIRAVGKYQPDPAVYSGVLPNKYQLYSNYPNPFNPRTTIAYDLPQAGEVNLEIFNILGQRVATLVEAYQEAGHYEVAWDSKDEGGQAVASGVYFYKLTTADFVNSRKMLLLK
ncbi:MAG: T9SS type A sorting domain-containing protein [FCB group bacterium]|nr:T9SS type A sorting domain-containing protein [FCB group bacterium]